jgi:hypothetical protein
MLTLPWPLQPGSGQYIQLIASKADASVLLSGDMTVTPGLWTRQVLATGAPAFGKYSNVALERWTFQQMLDTWSEVTGKKATYIQASMEEWTSLWGPMGTELALQFKFGEMCDPWDEKNTEGREFISAEELGIKPEEVPGCKATLQGLMAAGLIAL